MVQKRVAGSPPLILRSHTDNSPIIHRQSGGRRAQADRCAPLTSVTAVIPQPGEPSSRPRATGAVSAAVRPGRPVACRRRPGPTCSRRCCAVAAAVFGARLPELARHRPGSGPHWLRLCRGTARQQVVQPRTHLSAAPAPARASSPAARPRRPRLPSEATSHATAPAPDPRRRGGGGQRGPVTCGHKADEAWRL